MMMTLTTAKEIEVAKAIGEEMMIKTAKSIMNTAETTAGMVMTTQKATTTSNANTKKITSTMKKTATTTTMRIATTEILKIIAI